MASKIGQYFVKYSQYTHQHVCNWCSCKYRHTHRYFREVHRQFFKQCPNPKCLEFYKNGNYEQRKNPTDSQLIEAKKSKSEHREDRHGRSREENHTKREKDRHSGKKHKKSKSSRSRHHRSKRDRRK